VLSTDDLSPSVQQAEHNRAERRLPERSLDMAAITISIEPGELQSLRALAELDAVTTGRQPDVPGVAAALMRRALAASLRERGLAPAAPEAGRSIAAASAEPDSPVSAPRTRDRTRKYAASALAAAVLILLWGGYARRWGWTGFRANGQLWDWMSLLLLPVVVGILPLWIEHAGDIGRTKHVTSLAALAAFAAFAAAGYLVPPALDRLPQPDAVGLVRAAPAAGGTGHRADAAQARTLRTPRPEVGHRHPHLGVDRHHHRRLRAELEVDRLPGQHPVGLAAATVAAADCPDPLDTRAVQPDFRPRRAAGPRGEGR
jgi:hypothetical protein